MVLFQHFVNSTQPYPIEMKHLKLFVFLTIGFLLIQAKPAPKREFYEIKVYTFSSSEQEKIVSDFLKDAYLPALHKAGISKVGVFKPVESDTTFFGKRIYVLIPLTSLDQSVNIAVALENDKTFQTAGKNYLEAPYDKLPYDRLQSILLQAFSGMPKLEKPMHTTPSSERVYELRSYESHTEKIWKNKVHMFNEGDEIGLFKRLGFNAVFYGEVIAGSRMPNLMYMTSFNNMDSRNEHWKAFGADAQWKKLSSMPEYQHNVSKIDVFLLHPMEYSDL